MSSRVIILRRADTCSACATSLPAGTRAEWSASRRVVTCLPCVECASRGTAGRIERGRAGASAQREFAKRRRNREARVRSRHPRLGGLLLALGGTPQHERAWAQGAHGEQIVGASLDRRAARCGAIVLHDRRMPGGLGNIDHLVVAPSGVYVVDAKTVNGKVRVRHPLRGAPRLLVAGRDRTKFADGLDRQVAAVRDALARIGRADVTVEGALCFTRADLPLLGSSRIGVHRLCYQRALARRIGRSGPLAPSAIEKLAAALAVSFPPA